MTTLRTIGAVAQFTAIAGVIVVAFCVLLVAVLAVKVWAWARG